MDKQMVDLFLVMKQKYFAAEHLPYIRERLMQLTDEQFHTINGVELMDPTVMLLVSIFGGYLGVDRFLLGYPDGRAQAHHRWWLRDLDRHRLVPDPG